MYHLKPLLGALTLLGVLVLGASANPRQNLIIASGDSPLQNPFKWVPLLPIGGGGNSEESTLIPTHERVPLSDDVEELVGGNNRFAIDLFRQLAQQQDSVGNLFASPLSISSALGMTYAGARGRTAQQMADVLRFTLPDEQLHTAFGELVRDLDSNREGYQLNIANRLFGQLGYDLRQPFLDITTQHYAAPLEEVNFFGDPDGSRERVNTWIEEKTNDKIRDLLPPGSVTQDTRLVLTNAIYFNGQWKYKFDEDATHDAPFYAADGRVSETATMYQRQKFRYGDFNGFQVLEMPYAGDDLSMVVMLPDELDSLASLEAKLTDELIASSLAAMHEREVLVHLPTFKFEASFALGTTLQDMGMTDVFSTPDFSGIGDGNLAISDVLHKAFIDVNEAGTEAAAATAVIVEFTSVHHPSPPPVFRADHPFLFALRDVHSGSLMFIGRVAQPGASVISELTGTIIPEPCALMLIVSAAFSTLAGCRRH